MESLSGFETLHATVDIEIAALRALRGQFDESWRKALDMMLDCRGKVIVSGIGKSGIIARKIAATLASTGTPSFFLHPAEALHGDMGMAGGDDIILALSKSGESEEVNAMLTALRRTGTFVIVLTANPDSAMAHVADIVLCQGDAAEACPLNLAPTSSTTAALAAGDAMAVALMHMRRFSPEDFALRHPGGRLGKRLLLTVKEVMLAGDRNPVAPVDTPMSDILARISEKQAGALSLTHPDGTLAGLLTDYDLRRILQSGRNPLDVPPAEIMTPNPIVIADHEKAFTALCLMQGRKKPITILPVIDGNGRPVGMLRLHDLVGAGL
jgi:arabinose-5-phosphate isomerase